jgi:hypothetical protein
LGWVKNSFPPFFFSCLHLVAVYVYVKHKDICASSVASKMHSFTLTLSDHVFFAEGFAATFLCCLLQTDMFGLVGSIHVLVFGQYMKVFCSQGQWHMTSNFQR